VVLDLYARKPIGWSMSYSPDSQLTVRALAMAYESRGRPSDLCFTLIKEATIRALNSDNACGELQNTSELLT